MARHEVRARLATINALGHSHTRPGGNKAGRGWLQATRRTMLLLAVITVRRFSIVGLQEFQVVQQRAFRGRTNLWGCHDYKDNAVIWLRARWRVIERGHLDIPYFHGHEKPMPWVILERRSPIKRRRKRIAFLSTHNPASVRGEALHWRKEGWDREAAWANAMLERGDIDAAIVVGDKNSPRKVYQPFIERRGGRIAGVPAIWGIDWIVGWGDVRFTKHRTSKTRRIARMTDHPVEQATAILTIKESR